MKGQNRVQCLASSQLRDCGLSRRVGVNASSIGGRIGLSSRNHLAKPGSLALFSRSVTVALQHVIQPHRLLGNSRHKSIWSAEASL
jgi:hypothetical protein